MLQADSGPAAHRPLPSPAERETHTPRQRGRSGTARRTRGARAHQRRRHHNTWKFRRAARPDREVSDVIDTARGIAAQPVDRNPSGHRRPTFVAPNAAAASAHSTPRSPKALSRPKALDTQPPPDGPLRDARHAPLLPADVQHRARRGNARPHQMGLSTEAHRGRLALRHFGDATPSRAPGRCSAHRMPTQPAARRTRSPARCRRTWARPEI